MTNIFILPAIRIERHDGDVIDPAADYTAEDEAWENCGRWDQNDTRGLTDPCRLVGSEQCDFECPNNPNRRRKNVT